MKNCLYAFLMYFAFTAPVFAGVIVNGPAKGDHVTSPFYLSAYSTSCASHPTRTIGYSLDHSTNTTVFKGHTSINQTVSASAGTHIVHVKAWSGRPGEVCVTDVPITVTGAAPQARASSGSGNINVSSPSSGQHVVSPFTVSVDGYSCHGRSVKTLGYSIDHGDTTVFKGQSSIDAKASTSAGTHVLKVKAWTATSGDVCVVDVPITVSKVTDDVAADPSIVPSNAKTVSNIEVLNNWRHTNDSAVSGWSSGAMSLVGSPSHSGKSRKFVTEYKNYGAHRYTVAFDDNRTSRNFFYDAWVYIAGSSDDLANLEFDVDQTMPNGETVNFGVQCDGWTGRWAYSENAGTASHPKPHWANSKASCNPRSWSTGKWHHVQALYSRDDSGHLTYKYVWLDGQRQSIWVTVPNARKLGWGTEVTTQFQVDGHNKGSGKVTVYLDDLKISRW